MIGALSAVQIIGIVAAMLLHRRLDSQHKLFIHGRGIDWNVEACDAAKWQTIKFDINPLTFHSRSFLQSKIVFATVADGRCREWSYFESIHVRRVRTAWHDANSAWL
jgi:hypothetical protein